MTLEEMKDRKRELGLSNKEISARSGIPLGTVQKIFGGVTAAPRMETILALEKLLGPAKSRDDYDCGRMSSNHVAEPVPAYQAASSFVNEKRQGEYTVDDYYAMPGDRRVELIDGVIYDMAAPSYEHQLISGEVFSQLHDHLKKHKGRCRVIMAPFDVQLDMDVRTMVQPDILVICDKNKINSRGVYGAPDLAIEILSPSTARLDATLKLYKYMKAGVREYWIVDPENRQVLVYRNKEGNVILKVYTFSDAVPVSIWDEKCMIDFPDIAQQIDEWSD